MISDEAIIYNVWMQADSPPDAARMIMTYCSNGVENGMLFLSIRDFDRAANLMAEYYRLTELHNGLMNAGLLGVDDDFNPADWMVNDDETLA